MLVTDRKFGSAKLFDPTSSVWFGLMTHMYTALSLVLKENNKKNANRAQENNLFVCLLNLGFTPNLLKFFRFFVRSTVQV